MPAYVRYPPADRCVFTNHERETMSTGLTGRDIGRIPPVDRNGEMRRASALLARFRKQLTEVEPMDIDWQHWVAKSLLEGLPLPDDEAGGV